MLFYVDVCVCSVVWIWRNGRKPNAQVRGRENVAERTIDVFLSISYAYNVCMHRHRHGHRHERTSEDGDDDVSPFFLPIRPSVRSFTFVTDSNLSFWHQCEHLSSAKLFEKTGKERTNERTNEWLREHGREKQRWTIPVVFLFSR